MAVRNTYLYNNDASEINPRSTGLNWIQKGFIGAAVVYSLPPSDRDLVLDFVGVLFLGNMLFQVVESE